MLLFLFLLLLSLLHRQHAFRNEGKLRSGGNIVAGKNKSQKKQSHLQQRANPGLPLKRNFEKKQRFSKNNKETCPLFEDLPERIFCFGPILCTTKSQSRAAFF